MQEVSEKIKAVTDFLEANGIAYEIYHHPPLPTIEIALEYWKDIQSTHCKNLFMRNHKGNQHYLISFECHKELDIHSLEHMLHQGKLSFASPERMERCLGLCPGSVSPFGLIHDIDDHRVKCFFDSQLRDAEKVSFHPCDNTASVVISGADFQRFLAIWGGEWEWLDI